MGVVRQGWEEMENPCLVIITIKYVDLCDLRVSGCQL